MPADLAHWREGDLLFVKINGYFMTGESEGFKDRFLILLDSYQGKVRRLFFDLRGLKAVPPEVLNDLRDVENYLYQSDFKKIGTLFDNPVTASQHVRIIGETKAGPTFSAGERARIFDNYEACRAWLEEPFPRGPSPKGKIR